MKNSKQQQQQGRSTTVSLLLAYAFFGALHECAHLITALWLLPPSSLSTLLNHDSSTTTNNGYGSNIATLILRIILGRCLTIPLLDNTTDDDELTVLKSIITHSGWIASILIALTTHFLYKRQFYLFHQLNSSVVMIAYITALEGITTDLFGFVPHTHRGGGAGSESGGGGYMTFFCGNFGILLLNSSWLSIDGGRTALDVLEKMVSLVYSCMLIIVYICRDIGCG